MNLYLIDQLRILFISSKCNESEMVSDTISGKSKEM